MRIDKFSMNEKREVCHFVVVDATTSIEDIAPELGRAKPPAILFFLGGDSSLITIADKFCTRHSRYRAAVR